MDLSVYSRQRPYPLERFQNRVEAGRQLASRLLHLRDAAPIVVGLARGGVEVAAEVARILGASLDVLVARKVGAPAHPEYGIGAVAPGGVSVFDQTAVERIGISNEELVQITQSEIAEVERRLHLYRGDQPLDLQDKCVILIDDGLATGITALAALRYARSLHPSKLVFAVPVASQHGADLLSGEADEFVALHTPPLFHAVGEWYEDFMQTTDEQVLSLLQASRG
jgi:putative phosphoribosyl transferase